MYSCKRIIKVTIMKLFVNTKYDCFCKLKIWQIKSLIWNISSKTTSSNSVNKENIVKLKTPIINIHDFTCVT